MFKTTKYYINNLDNYLLSKTQSLVYCLQKVTKYPVEHMIRILYGLTCLNIPIELSGIFLVTSIFIFEEELRRYSLNRQRDLKWIRLAQLFSQSLILFYLGIATLLFGNVFELKIFLISLSWVFPYYLLSTPKVTYKI